MRLGSLIGACLLAAAFSLPLVWSSPASAESGAHRVPPPPPVDTPLELAALD